MVNTDTRAAARTRRITLAAKDRYGDEPLLEIARRRVAAEGGSLRPILNELRKERLERAKRIALASAPAAQPRPDGGYVRVSADPRWPFGVQNELVIAPFGLGVAGLPRTVDPTLQRNGPLANARTAQREARDIISAKLERLGCDPIVIMAEIALDKENVKDEVRLRAAAELASMVYPRLRSVESTSREEKTVFVIGIPAEQPKTTEAWLTMIDKSKSIEGEKVDAATPEA